MIGDREGQSGKGRLCAKYGFKKPNDGQALDLMNATAAAVMAEIPDLFLAYGVSDEFRYVLLLSLIERSMVFSFLSSLVFHSCFLLWVE